MIPYDNNVIMASNPFFSGRIPQPLSDAIEAHRKQTEESKTEVLTRALAQYVKHELSEDKPKIPPIQEKLDDIFRRLSILEKQSITPDNNAKKIIEQLEITPDTTVINSNDINQITDDNKTQILSTRDAATLIGKGCSSSSLSRWKRQNELPKVKNGYQIENASKGKWKITTIDNNDN